jgi:hypothetical protein
MMKMMMVIMIMMACDGPAIDALGLCMSSGGGTDDASTDMDNRRLRAYTNGRVATLNRHPTDLEQRPLDVVDSVNQTRVHLNLPPPKHLDRPRHADAALVVSIHVSAHCQFRFFLDAVQELLRARKRHFTSSAP